MGMRCRRLGLVLLSAFAVLGCSADGATPEASGGTPIATDTSVAPPAAESACPEDDSALSAGGMAEADVLTAVPAEVSSVLLCTIEGDSKGPLHPLASEPLVVVTDPAQLDRLAQAVNAPPRIGNTRGCGISSPPNVLVFRHLDGAVTYGFDVRPSCSFLTDGNVSRGVPQEVVALLPGVAPPSLHK